MAASRQLLPGATSRMPRAHTLPSTDDSEDAATIEVERMDPADLLPIVDGASLSELVGPLERRSSKEELPSEAHTRPSVLVDPELVYGTQSKAAKRSETLTALTSRLTQGPVRWLLPLGLLAISTLGLALWVVLR